MALEVHEEIDGQGRHSLDEGQRGHVSAEVICGSGLSSLKPLSDSILTCTCFMPPHLSSDGATPGMLVQMSLAKQLSA